MIRKLVIKIYGKIKVFIYMRILSTAKVVGRSFKVKSPTQFIGLGRIEIDEATIGYFPSPGFLSSSGYIEARFPSSSINIGNGTIISNGAAIIAEKETIRIGNNCRIGFGFYVSDSDFHATDIQSRNSGFHSCKSVSIGDDVFIGINVKIMKGVCVGDGSVIGAGSIVTHDVGDNEVWCGVPAKKVGICN